MNLQRMKLAWMTKKIGNEIENMQRELSTRKAGVCSNENFAAAARSMWQWLTMKKRRE